MAFEEIEEITYGCDNKDKQGVKCKKCIYSIQEDKEWSCLFRYME